MWPQAILALARSAIVLVTLHNIRGDSIHSMSSTVMAAMRGSLSDNVLGTAIASLSIVEDEKPTFKNALARLNLMRLSIP